MLDPNTLREKYPHFVYENFSSSKNGNNFFIKFKFKISELEFNPSLEIEETDFSKLEKLKLDNFIFNLGLIEMLSYWKATCSPLIEIKAGNLTQEQINWWLDLLQKGLGEFFYQNKINFREDKFVTIKAPKNDLYQKDTDNHLDRYLLLNSGGRDSVVSAEILKNLKKETTLLMLNPTRAAQEVANQSGIQKRIIIRREIDKTLLDLNQKGFLNGHTPFSAYLAFLSMLCAVIFDYKFIAVSNERSSNEQNLEYLGVKINHQYSKSFEFEESFREYSKKYLAENIEYFSVLRPLYELQISKLFSRYKNYFANFKSCNVGQKQNIWCCKCPKCLSIFITLFPFLEDYEIEGIFSKNLYEDQTLANLLMQITGEKVPKPFECVGTYDEILAGLKLSIEKLGKEDKPLPFLLQYAKENILTEKQTKSELLIVWDENNFLPEEIAKSLKGQIA